MKTLKDRLDVKLGYISKNRDTRSLTQPKTSGFYEDNICITYLSENPLQKICYTRRKKLNLQMNRHENAEKLKYKM